MDSNFEHLMALGETFRRAASAERPVDRAAGGPAAGKARPPTTFVVNRRGEKVPVQFDRITERNEKLRSDPRYGPELAVIDSPRITTEVVGRFRNGMTTRELDAETAAICVQLSTRHSDYELLAARVYVSDLHKRTPADLAELVDALVGAGAARLSHEFVEVVRRGAARIAARIDFGRDFRLRFFGYQTVARSYLLRPGGRTEESSLLDDSLMERPQHLYMRVAIGLFVCQPGGEGHLAPEAEFDARLTKAFRLYDALSLQLVSNATPTMLNASTIVSQLSSCFQIATGDDLATLFDTVKSAAMISKWSGGVSLWLHNVRAEGAPIRSTGGRSTGIAPYCRIQNDVQVYVNQGGNRPGAFALYLGVDHDDVFTFLAMARKKGEEAVKSLTAPDLKYALWVPDLFMEALEEQLAATAKHGSDIGAAGDWYLFSPDEAPGLHLVYGEEYRALYQRYVAEKRYRRRVKASEILNEAYRTWAQVGVPYVLYKDSINVKSNMKNVAPIASSNLCVAGDTLVLTDAGHLPIASLAGRQARVWNGAEWSGVTVARTNDAADLMRIKLDNGTSVDCTPYHKWYTVAGGKVREIRAGELAPGDVLEACSQWPVVRDGVTLPNAYASGAAAKRPEEVPIGGADVASRLEWLAGLFDAGPNGVSSADPAFIERVRLLLHTLGVEVAILVKNARRWIALAQQDFDALLGLGFRPRKSFGGPMRRRDALGAGRVKVVSVEALPGQHPTFCFNEPLRHRGVFNGVLTGQCCEITIPSWSDFDAPEFAKFHPDNAAGGEFGVCNLAAICLESFIIDDGEPRVDFAGIAAAAALEVEALNRIIDLNYYPTEECRRGNQRHRPVGVGVMGLADVFARLRIAYDSPRATELARAIAAAVYFGALSESARLARVEGSYSTFPGSPISEGRLQPDLWVESGHLEPGWESEVEAATGGAITAADWDDLRARVCDGVRNAYVTAYMPTATTSNIVGQNECFEPFTSNIYTRKTLAGEFFVVNRHLMRELAELGLWGEEMRRGILAASGSVQSLAAVPEDVRRRYRTAREIHPSRIIKMAKSMAPFICQSMSMNMYLDDPDLPKIIRFLLEGWHAGLKCGLYYCHTRPVVGSQKTSVRVASAAPVEVCTRENKEGCTVCSV
jgi:ribonucleotide reductase alpha subunit